MTSETTVGVGSPSDPDGSPTWDPNLTLGPGWDDKGDPLAWMADGVCTQVDADLWFPNKGETSKVAKSLCASCPVRATCLDYALTTGEVYGVWGGKSERERRRLRNVA